MNSPHNFGRKDDSVLLSEESQAVDQLPTPRIRFLKLPQCRRISLSSTGSCLLSQQGQLLQHPSISSQSSHLLHSQSSWVFAPHMLHGLLFLISESYSHLRPICTNTTTKTTTTTTTTTRKPTSKSSFSDLISFNSLLHDLIMIMIMMINCESVNNW